jgi:hypothetical protein
MIKGTQKKIIHIKDIKSSIFGEAYFVLKSDVKENVTEPDMVKEAAKIVDENLMEVYCSNLLSSAKRAVTAANKAKKPSAAVLGFIAGASVCSGVIGFIALVMYIA